MPYFHVATKERHMKDIGDEPFQMKKKFSGINVAVDHKRTRGIENIIHDHKDTGVILLDDAFQHRYVKPGINILLVDYHRLIIYDKLLPAGRLREPLSGKNRADIVIITKCPKDLKPMEFRVLTKSMDLYPYQSLFFSTIDYDTLYPLFNKDGNKITKQQLKQTNVLLVSGIASPKQIIVDMKQHVASMTPLTFADHHQFSEKDAERINESFANLKGNKIIITTEKDATRLEDINGIDDEVKSHIYVLPIKVRFMLDQENVFNDKIIDYVRKNSRNSILAKGKDDNKSKDCNNSGNGPGTISFRNN